ncbi:MAG: division/cell wall cluster transcriptional repressor MraZ, partial [Candidatus Kapabacteria bacterium]|nr:division/cell wall cluster transcriptional repressor MraZ [Candidatus Kapabacteria bacterium]
ERFARLNQYDTQERFFLRMILAWSEEVQLDAQQRLMLPRRHIEFAGIQTKVTIVGMGDHLEFWNPEEFDRYLAAFAQSYEEVAAHVMRSP